jgi:hypothetical protein
MKTFTRSSILALIAVLFSASALAQYSQPVRDVEKPAHSPLRIKGVVTVSAGEVGWFGNTIGPVVAADRRFVIEYVGVECYSIGGVEAVGVWLRTAEKRGDGTFAPHN